MTTLVSRVGPLGRAAQLPVVADLPALLLGVAVVTPVASVDGGWASTSWGWPALALAWAAVVAVLLRSDLELARLELLAVGALGAFAVWTALSTTWSGDAGGSVLSLERVLLYLAALAAACTLVRTRAYASLLGSVWVAATLVCGYGVLTRLYPSRFHVLIGISGNRLAAPVGYWNGLGLLAAVGVLLAVALAASGRSRTLSGLAAASLVPLSLALYFTYSRGAWVALMIGVLTAFAFDPRRLRYAVTWIAVGVWPALAVAEASRQSALTSAKVVVASEATQGAHLARMALLWAAAAALAAIVLAGIDRRYVPTRVVQRSFTAVLALAVVVAVVGVSAVYGSPPTLVRKAWHSFSARPPALSNNLNARLFSLSSNGRVDLWKAALADWRDHPIVGSGAGTYQREWFARRTIAQQVVNAHSLYLETLAELGPFGLILLLVALLAPVAAAVRARGQPLVAGATAAYVAFLLHAAIDWDWQLPGVALAPFLCGAALLVAARRDPIVLNLRARAAVVVALAVVALVSIVGLVGNRAAAAASSAAQHENWPRSVAQAQRAASWAPWSSRPLQLLGEAELQQGNLAAARQHLRRAIAKSPRSWQLWLDLAFATESRAGRRSAALRALALDPVSPEIDQVRPALGLPPSKRP